MEDLNLAISKLKSNKARDFEGYSNELFKNNIIGSDLKKSLLLMFNEIKHLGNPAIYGSFWKCP